MFLLKYQRALILQAIAMPDTEIHSTGGFNTCKISFLSSTTA